MVVANHFWLPVANKIGANAVASFYIISGFLMTHSIVREYGASYKGVFFFLSNRALRIFPAYWAVLFISVGLLWLFPTTFGDTYSTMKMPEGSWQWWQNLLLVDLSTSPSVVSPPAWTLSVELFFYIAMPLALSRSKTMSLVWLLVSIAYTIYLLGVGATFSERYTPAVAASVFFAAGACLFHYKPTFALPVSVASVAAALFVIFPLLVERSGGDRLMFGFYGGAALFIPIFLTFISFRDDRLTNTVECPPFRRTDQLLRQCFDELPWGGHFER
jgi:peptidoglycan/LPS O-acetylase OafA/YrhL